MAQNQTVTSDDFAFALLKKNIECYYTGVNVNFSLQLTKEIGVS